jgi:hypothetical protein
MSSQSDATKKKRKVSDDGPEQGEEKNWHPLFRKDRQTVTFVSKDDQYFSVDKDLLARER